MKNTQMNINKQYPYSFKIAKLWQIIFTLQQVFGDHLVYKQF